MTALFLDSLADLPPCDRETKSAHDEDNDLIAVGSDSRTAEHTDPGEEASAAPSPAPHSPSLSIPGEQEYLAFAEAHRSRLIRPGHLPANTQGPKSTSPVIVTARKSTASAHSADFEFTRGDDPSPIPTKRASLAIPRVSVKSRIAAFENRSPTTTAFFTSPPRAERLDSPETSLASSPGIQQRGGELADITRDPNRPSSAPARSLRYPFVLTEGRESPAYPSSPPLILTRSPKRLLSVPYPGASRFDPTSESTGSVGYQSKQTPPRSPFQSTLRLPQGLDSTRDHQEQLVASSSAYDFEQAEQPRTPRLQYSGLVSPAPSFFQLSPASSRPRASPPRPTLRIPSFGFRVHPRSQLDRIKHDEPAEPGLRGEATSTRIARYTPRSRLSEVFTAQPATRKISPKVDVEPSPFDDGDGKNPFGPGTSETGQAREPKRASQGAYPTKKSTRGVQLTSSAFSGFEFGFGHIQAALRQRTSDDRLKSPVQRPYRKLKLLQGQESRPCPTRGESVGISKGDLGNPTSQEIEEQDSVNFVIEQVDELIPPITRERILEKILLSDSESDTASEKMDLLHPNSAMAMTHHRREAVRLAKAQEIAVTERCKRSNVVVPEYAFDELIGKGSFGRVYKGYVT